MKKHLRDFAKILPGADLNALPELEKRVVTHYNERLPISHDTNVEFEKELTFGQRLADKVASFGGSWAFISIFLIALIVWVALNSFFLARSNDSFDPYPYILLNLFLSMIAALQAPIILMSQNRQSVKDRLDAAHDYEVNLKAELEILGLHQKIDELRESKWQDLMSMQQEQIKLLTRLLEENDVRQS